ncbi:protein NODULATION SIGNALING PATHWAY 2-like [Actinidia eriantha]|uniref:protein NODULATION SIGNALING PATHWAY 2-like n=1 Tax=Actinidia eriantha TaxID=165200 RepID=UPI00258E945C|nr:protein NODULATION SIGNALING PATHWAY 2-like [Actinidia eriantha]
MIRPDLLQPSMWPSFNNMNSSFDEDEDCLFDIDANMFSDGFIDFPDHQLDRLDGVLLEDDFSLDLKEFEATLSEIGDMAESFEHEKLPINEKDQQTSLILPTDDTEIDNSLSLVHLIRAYEEAMEKEQRELAEVITKRVGEKVSPVAEIMDRVLYYLFQPLDKQLDYLKQESSKNFYTAFKAFYQIFPYGTFAHFAANLAILEAMPRDVEIIHIVDFDIGEGIQWSSMIEAIECERKEIRLTSIKWTEDDSSYDTSGSWRFDETKRRLLDHARAYGLNLAVEEVELHNLESEIEKMKRGGRGEWFSFNCMVGLPHMGRVRSRRHVIEFLKVAKGILVHPPNCHISSTKGIITFGDGDAWEILKESPCFGSFFNGYLVHYQALLESMEFTFQNHLGEARTAMECLFVAPFVSSLGWIQKWKEREALCYFELSCELEKWKVSKESLMEAKEMVREGVSPYRVMVEDENNNELVLQWRGIKLVKVSFWRKS